MMNFHTILSVDKYGSKGFSFATYPFENIKQCNDIIGCDINNYPLKIKIDKIRRLEQFRIISTYMFIEEVYYASIIES